MRFHFSNISKLFVYFCIFVASSFASFGDRSLHFQNCFHPCYNQNCTSPEKFSRNQPLILKLTAWSCENECSYQCMWKTEEYYREYDVKFYGKWPFVRVLGIQEIVSVVASILNLASHVYMLGIMRKKLHPSLPLFHLWRGLGYCAINAWFWSAVFHTRDTSFTEKMDYFGALSIILTMLYAFIVRITYGYERFHWCLTIAAICYYISHCSYMHFVEFDYGFNMKVNLTFGISNSLGWIIWWLVAHKRLPHLYKSTICIISTMALMSLEVWDFPPVFYLFDAHSLWHLGTAPIALLMYRFIIDDCLYLHKQSTNK